MTTKDPRAEAEGENPLFEAYLKNKEMEKLESYLVRGRQLAALDDADLRERYVEAHKAWAADVKNHDAMRGVGDVVAEFALRNQREPLELVVHEMHAILSYAAQVGKELEERVEDPVVQRAVGEDYLTFSKAALDPKPKN